MRQLVTTADQFGHILKQKNLFTILDSRNYSFHLYIFFKNEKNESSVFANFEKTDFRQKRKKLHPCACHCFSGASSSVTHDRRRVVCYMLESSLASGTVVSSIC